MLVKLAWHFSAVSAVGVSLQPAMRLHIDSGLALNAATCLHASKLTARHNKPTKAASQGDADPSLETTPVVSLGSWARRARRRVTVFAGLEGASI